jgi:hypothetical protein
LAEVAREEPVGRPRGAWRRRLVVGVVAAALLGASFVGGMATGRVTDDDSVEGITESEHDRLLDTCIAETDEAGGCATVMADAIEMADADGWSYSRLTEWLDCVYDERRFSVPDLDNCRSDPPG